jgi:hypothetical protein
VVAAASPAAARCGISVLGLGCRRLLQRRCGAAKVWWRLVLRSSRLPGVALFWSWFVVGGWRRRSSLRRQPESAMVGWRWLGDVSPPMFVQHLRFRCPGRMDIAALRRSFAAIGLRLLFGVRQARLLPLRWCSGGAGVRQWWAPWWLSSRTCRDPVVFFLFARVLFALSP